MAASATATDLVCEDEQRFWVCLRQHYSARGINPAWETRPGTRWPAGSKKVNAHVLFADIRARGGFDNASLDKRNWWEAAESAGVPKGLAGTLSYQVKLLYAERLLSFEQALAVTPASAVPSASQAQDANSALPKLPRPKPTGKRKRAE